MLRCVSSTTTSNLHFHLRTAGLTPGVQHHLVSAPEAAARAPAYMATTAPPALTPASHTALLFSGCRKVAVSAALACVCAAGRKLAGQRGCKRGKGRGEKRGCFVLTDERRQCRSHAISGRSLFLLRVVRALPARYSGNAATLAARQGQPLSCGKSRRLREGIQSGQKGWQ